MGELKWKKQSNQLLDELYDNHVQNDTKLYRNEAKSFTSEQFEFMQNALETVKQIHQSSLQTYSYNVKLLTDGQNHLEEENLKLVLDLKSHMRLLRPFPLVRTSNNFLNIFFN